MVDTQLPVQYGDFPQQPEPASPVDVEMDGATPNEDGSVDVVVGDSPTDSDPSEIPAFDANLAEHMDEGELLSLGMELSRLFGEDFASRDDWSRALAKGLDSLGFKHEDRTSPWPGAFGAHHPLLAEAVVRFQSNCIMEIFPSEAGPVKGKVVGEITPDVEDQCERVVDYMNYVTTERMTDYRLETEKLLFNLGCAGSAFRKVYPDPISDMRPEARFIPAEDFVVPYGASSLKTAPRYTHIMRMPRNDVRKMQVAGFYRDIDLGEPMSVGNTNEVTEKKDQIAKEQNQLTHQDNYELLEMHVDLDFDGLDESDGVALPYIVTMERTTHTILSIRRNWQENDPKREKILHFAAYHFIPGFGFYGFGLIHLIGAIAKGATALLRQLIDAGTLSNLPGGMKTKEARMKDAGPINPGEWRDVDILQGDLQKAFMPLPYKEPSAVLFSLLENVVEEGRRLGSTASVDIGDMGAQAPVGTTLAIMERSLKIISAIQARVHNSLHEEFRILARVIKESLPEDGEYPYNVHGGNRKIKREDFDDRVDVLPVSNLNSSTMAERVLQYQAASQLQAQAPPGTFEVVPLYRGFLRTLGVKDVDAIVPDKSDIPLRDPIEENRLVMVGTPIKAYEQQNHAAHIEVHSAFAQDPKIAAQMGQNPQAQVMFNALQAHIAEHIGFQYRIEMEQKLGVPLLGADQPMPADVESSLSLAIADASQRLLDQHKSEDAQKKAQAAAQDPVLQIQQAEVAVKAAAIQQKDRDSERRAQTTLQAAQMREQTEQMRIGSQHHMAGQNAGLQSAQSEQEKQIELEELSVKVEKTKAEILEILARIEQMQKPQPPPSGGFGA